MANVLSLALRVTADATGLKLTPVERALKGLGDQADKLSSQFTKFSGDSDAAAKAQERFARQSQELINTLKSGGPEAAAKFAAEFEKLAAAADKEAAAFERAAKITEANLSAFERFTRTQRELKEQVDAGRISQETYNRAIEGAAKGLTDAERGAAGLGARTQEVNAAAEGSALKFNELSGIFAVLPGPLGNIAGRISGIASASEGLGRVFQGGLLQGVGNLASSFAALVNPVTIALAGITAFAAGATAVTQGLVSLEDKVEKLGNLANQLGASFGFVQALDEAGRRTGVSIESVSTAFGRLQRTLADGGDEGEKANKALQKVGLTLNELNGLSEDDKIRAIGRQIAAIEDPAERSAAAVALFGRQGLALLPFFDNLERAEKAMEKFGATVSDVDKERIDALGVSFDDVGTSLLGLGRTLLAPFAGLVSGIADAIANAIGAVTNSIGPILERLTPILDAVGRQFTAWGLAIFDASQQATSALQPVIDVFTSVFAFFNNVVQAALPGITSAFESLFATVTQLTKVFTDSFGAIVNVIGEVFAAFTSLLGFSEVGDFATAIGEAYNFLFEAVAQVITIVGDVLEVVNRFATVAFVAIGKVVTTFINLVSTVSEFLGIGVALQAIGGVIASVFGSVAGVFSTIANAIGGVVGRLLGMAERFLGIDRSAKEAAASTQGIADATETLNDKTATSVKQAEDLAAEEKERQKAVEQQIAAVDKLIEASEKQQRIESEFGGSSARFDAAERILTIESEIARVQELQRAANEAGDTAAAAAAASRLGTLDQVVARERANAEQLAASQEAAAEAAAQGFSSGFESAFDAANKGISGLIDKAAEFGNEGAIAAARLQEGIEAAQEQVRAGILNREGFEQEVARQKKLADARIKDLEGVKKITEDIAKQEANIRERQFEVDLARLEELNTVRTGSVEVADIRSGGIGAFFATLREDPAVSEAKKQTAELTKLNKNIEKLEAQRVDILAGTG